MPPVQLARLRPQVNALMAHYQDREYFRKTLLLLLEKYSEKKSATNTWLQDDHNIPAYRVPLIVMNELESALQILAKTHPQACIPLAETLWAQTHYEPRKLAIFLLAKLASPFQEQFVLHMRDWISADLDQNLIREIIEQSGRKPEIVTSSQWINLVRSWINSSENDLQRIGIRAVALLVEDRAFQNLPLVFELITPLYTQPNFAVQKNVMDLTRKLIERSQPETASFFISLAEVHREEPIYALIRKSLPLFDPLYQDEIRKTVIN